MAHAVISASWIKRTLIATAAFGAFAAWCIYDGAISYPAFNRRAARYNQVVVVQGQPEVWQEDARSKGWELAFFVDDLNPDGMVKLKSALDISIQFMMGGACAIGVGYLLWRLAWARRRTMQSTEEGFQTVEGSFVPYSAVTAIDRAKWEKKSIAVVSYEKNGLPAKTTIDDWIFRGAAQVLNDIESRAACSKSAQGTVDN